MIQPVAVFYTDSGPSILGLLDFAGCLRWLGMGNCLGMIIVICLVAGGLFSAVIAAPTDAGGDMFWAAIIILVLGSWLFSTKS